MVKCVFCGTEASFQTGIHLLKNDGTVDYYCSGKCRKNALNLGRDKKKIKWTESYKTQRTKESVKVAAAEKAAEEKKTAVKK